MPVFLRPMNKICEKGESVMEMPMLDVLKEKNVYSGSEGDFRFKVTPDKDVLKAVAYQRYCLEYCRENDLILGEAEFPATPEGMEQLDVWLKELAAQMETATPGK